MYTFDTIPQTHQTQSRQIAELQALIKTLEVSFEPNICYWLPVIDLCLLLTAMYLCIHLG